MHEWALSDSVASAASAVAKDKKINSVSKVVVVLGEVQNIAPDVFKEIFDEVKKQYNFVQTAELVIEKEEALFKCNRCGAAFKMEREALSHEKLEDIHFVPEVAVTYISCPKCKSKDFEIKAGRGLYIKEIEGDNA